MNAPVQHWHEERHAGSAWLFRPGLADMLFADGAFLLRRWREQGLAQIVKHNPQRTVYRVALPQLCFYIKHFHPRRALDRLRQVFAPSKARAEFALAHDLAQRDIATVYPLALGQPHHLFGPRDEFLITQALERCEPLQQFLLHRLWHADAPALRLQLFTELGGFLAKLHAAGVLHRDLHAANVMVRENLDQSLAFVLLDLPEIRLLRRLTWPQRRDNLVLLNRWFQARASHADRLRAWRAYAETFARLTGEAAPALEQTLLAEIEAQTRVDNQRFFRARDKRCFEKNNYYRPVREGSLAGHATTSLDASDLARLLADPDAPFEQPGARLLKNSRSSTVCELEVAVQGRPIRAIFKRFRVTSRWDGPASLARLSPALRSWANGQGFFERGLPSPRPLLVLQRRKLGLAWEGYLLTEKIEDALELHACLASLKTMPPRERLNAQRALIACVAREIRRLHEAHGSHRDLKASNLLVTAPRPGPSQADDPNNLLYLPRSGVWLIDLVGVEWTRRLGRARKVQNLTRLNASFHGRSEITRTDRLRFLRIYLDANRTGRGDWKGWWREIAAATAHKVARNERRGRPLW